MTKGFKHEMVTPLQIMAKFPHCGLGIACQLSAFNLIDWSSWCLLLIESTVGSFRAVRGSRGAVRHVSVFRRDRVTVSDMPNSEEMP